MQLAQKETIYSWDRVDLIGWKQANRILKVDEKELEGKGNMQVPLADRGNTRIEHIHVKGIDMIWFKCRIYA